MFSLTRIGRQFFNTISQALHDVYKWEPQLENLHEVHKLDEHLFFELVEYLDKEGLIKKAVFIEEVSSDMDPSVNIKITGEK